MKEKTWTTCTHADETEWMCLLPAESDYVTARVDIARDIFVVGSTVRTLAYCGDEIRGSSAFVSEVQIGRCRTVFDSVTGTR